MKVERIHLPSLTNLNTAAYPLEITLPRLAKSKSDIDSQKFAVTGKKEKRQWTQTKNYLSALGQLGLWRSGKGLTAEGLVLEEVARSRSVTEFKAALGRYVMTKTSLALVVHSLEFISPYFSGSQVKRECEKTLEIAFNVEVPSRKQSMDYTFSFLRYAGLLDENDAPRIKHLRGLMGIKYDKYLAALSHLSEDEAIVLAALIQRAANGWIRAENLKQEIRLESGRIIEVGLGAAGNGRKLQVKGLIEVNGGKGKGNRHTELRVKQTSVADFLSSPLARSYIFRANFEAGGLLSNLDKIVGEPLAKTFERAKRSKDGKHLEILAAKVAFQLGCVDITMRSRQNLPGLPEGEKDVLATFTRPVPSRVLIQCKAHKAKLGTAELYRELAIALLSTQVRTVLFIAPAGYQQSTELVQKAALRAFPHLTIVLFDGSDVKRMVDDDSSIVEVVRERMTDVGELQRSIEESLTPRQLRAVVQALRENGIKQKDVTGIVERLWSPSWWPMSDGPAQ